MNYIAKFSSGGRNANIWNGPSTITTDENFTVFNFQSLLANRNGTIANAQMLLVLKYIDNEIIKNREYNTRNNLSRKVVVVIDEAHVFIDEKYPVALDFMFQLAKRIRKYNGMQIVITQNIKDFVGTEEIARKSTAIINACQYSFIFSLAPNDMDDLCKLYEKAGGINEQEQEQIVSAPRGQAFTVMGPASRTTFKVEGPEDVVAMFQERGFESRYFIGEEGAQYWEDFIGNSRTRHDEVMKLRKADEEEAIQKIEETLRTNKVIA
jgi:type IV secretory pathway VirB4 component